MKFTNEQVSELVDRFAEYLQARKKLRKCFKGSSGGSPAYFCQFESDARDAALTALTRELNGVLPSEFTLFERDQIAMLEAQERAKKDPWRDGYPPWEPIPPEQKGGR